MQLAAAVHQHPCSCARATEKSIPQAQAAAAEHRTEALNSAAAKKFNS